MPLPGRVAIRWQWRGREALALYTKSRHNTQFCAILDFAAQGWHDQGMSIAQTSPTERAAAALLALAALTGCALLAHAVGLGLAATALLLVPALLVLLPARIAAEIVGTARRRGAMASALASAITTVAEAATSLLAGAALLVGGAVFDMLDARRVTDAHTEILIHDITPRSEQLTALLRARLHAIAATLAARILPAPIAAAHIRASA